MKDDKKSIIKEALTDYQEIMEAADANAKKKLAEEFPDKFNNLLKEEINKNKKSVKESYKKLDDDEESDISDEADLNNESVMENQKKETPKVVKGTVGNGKPFGEKPKGVAKVDEDVKITDTIGDSDPFKEKAKGAKKIDEEREKDFMGDVEGKTPNVGKGELEKGVAFKDKIKGPSSGKPMTNLTEEFDLTGLGDDEIGASIGGAEDDDEVLTMEQIEEEIASMQGLGEELNNMSGMPRPELEKQGSPKNQGGDAYSQLVQMRKQLDEMINNLGGVNEMSTPQAGEFDSRMVQEEEISDDEINAVLGAPSEMGEAYELTNPDTGEVASSLPDEVEIDEAMGISYSAGTITPGKLGDHEGTHGRFRQDESKKKINGLINENKSLTKKLNEVKGYKKNVGTLLEQYKTALDKYRNQLKEMAVFNTNLAHVNNLLVNEGLALTQDDKIKIINEFKKVDTIAESQKKYKNFLTEMKESKKTLTESIEEKVTTSIQPSSKQKLDEVTAYKDDKHIQKMRSLIEYVEKRGKKIIK